MTTAVELRKTGNPVSEKNSSRKLMNNGPYEGQQVRRADLTIIPAIRGSLSDRLGWGLGPRGPRSTSLSKPGGTIGGMERDYTGDCLYLRGPQHFTNLESSLKGSVIPPQSPFLRPRSAS